MRRDVDLLLEDGKRLYGPAITGPISDMRPFQEFIRGLSKWEARRLVTRLLGLLPRHPPGPQVDAPLEIVEAKGERAARFFTAQRDKVAEWCRKNDVEYDDGFGSGPAFCVADSDRGVYVQVFDGWWIVVEGRKSWVYDDARFQRFTAP